MKFIIELISKLDEQRFSDPLSGYHIVYRKSGIPVLNTPSFETPDQAQKYLMTKMFSNHQDYKVVHTAKLGLTEAVDFRKEAAKHMKDLHSKSSTPAQREYAQKMLQRALEAAKMKDKEAATKHYLGIDAKLNELNVMDRTSSVRRGNYVHPDKSKKPGDDSGTHNVVDSSGKVVASYKNKMDAIDHANKKDEYRVKSVYEEVEDIVESYTGRETKDGTWHVFKTGKAVAVAGPFESREEASAWIKKQKIEEAQFWGNEEMAKQANAASGSTTTMRGRDEKGVYTATLVRKKGESEHKEVSRVYDTKEEQSSKTGIYQTDVFGAKAYHAKCMEPNCNWESKRFDRIKQAQAAAEKHSKVHFKQGVTEDNVNLPTVLYHATYKPRLKSIKLKGLGAGGKRNWEDSKRGIVYLALDPNVAESYAETSDMVPEEWLDEIVILKISTAGLDPNKFHIDSNVQDNAGDTVEYHGVIPVSNISMYKQGVAENNVEQVTEYTVIDRYDPNEFIKYGKQNKDRLKPVDTPLTLFNVRYDDMDRTGASYYFYDKQTDKCVGFFTVQTYAYDTQFTGLKRKLKSGIKAVTPHMGLAKEIQRQGISTLVYNTFLRGGPWVFVTSQHTEAASKLWNSLVKDDIISFYVSDETGKIIKTPISYHDYRVLGPKNRFNIKSQGVAEGKQQVERNGIQLNVSIDGATVDIRPIIDGNQVGYVVFDRDGETLVADDLAIDEEYRGRGIAKIIYDYLKELGFTVKRSTDQLPAGKAFWDKYKGAQGQVWEDEHVDEMALSTYKTMGDFSKPGPFRGPDKKLVPHHKKLDEAISVEHDRYMRSHGKKASGTGDWMFTHKRMGDVDYNNDKEVHQAKGSFADAAKSAKAWAKSHGYSAVYVMEEIANEEASKLQGTPVVSLSDFSDKDSTKNKYGQTVPKKLKPNDQRISFLKDTKCPGCHSMDIKTYSDGEKECNDCHKTWDIKDKMNESIKGWKHAMADIMKARASSSNESAQVKLVKLKKDGSESKMHDSVSYFKTEKDARQKHEYLVKINPGKSITHNLYVGDTVERLG